MPFDPSQAFEVLPGPANGAPAFNPSAPFEFVKDAPPPQPKLIEPELRAAPEPTVFEKAKGMVKSVREKLSPLIGQTQSEIQEARKTLGFPDDKSDDDFLAAYPLRELNQKGLIPKLWEVASTPIVSSEKLFDLTPQGQAADTVAKAVLPEGAFKVEQGVKHAVFKAADFFLTPAGVALGGMGALPKAAQAAISGYFAFTMAKDAPESFKAMSKAMEAGDTEAAAEHGATGLLNLGMAGLAGAHAIKSVKGPPIIDAEFAPPKVPEKVRVEVETTPDGKTFLLFDGSRQKLLPPPPESLPAPETPKMVEANEADTPALPSVQDELKSDGYTVQEAKDKTPELVTNLKDEDLKRNYAEHVEKILKHGERGELVPSDLQARAGGLIDEINRRNISMRPDTGKLRRGEPILQQSEIIDAEIVESNPVADYAQTPEAHSKARVIASQYTRGLNASVDELATDAITELWLRAPKWKDQPVDKWSATVMDNYFKDRLDKRDPLRQAEEVPENAVAPETTEPMTDVLDIYRKAKGKLDPIERVILDHYQGESRVKLSTIAKTVGVTEQAISQRLPKIRAKLAREMSRQGIELPDFIKIHAGLNGEGKGTRSGGMKMPKDFKRQREGGFINPQVLQSVINVVKNLAGRGMGYARAVKSMVGMFGRRVLPYVSRAWTKVVRGGSADPFNPKGVERVARKAFASRGLLPEAVDVRAGEMRGKVSAANQKILFALKDIERAGRRYRGLKGFTDADTRAIADFMGGQASTLPFPARVAAPIVAARQHIDRNSLDMLGAGLGNQNTFIANLGKYLSRSYQIHTDRNFAKKIKPADREAAIQHVMTQLGSGRLEAEGVVNEIVNLNSAGQDWMYRKGATVGSKNLGILMKRKQIDPVIRKLLGENVDPLVNYAVTAGKQAALLEAHKFLGDVRQAGLGRFLHEKPLGEYAVRISADGYPRLAPLDGLYTTPDIYEAFKTADSAMSQEGIAKAYSVFNSYVNWAHTVGNFPASHVRNVVANPAISIFNGNWRAWKALEATRAVLPDAVRQSLNDLGWMDNKQARADVIRMSELGLFDDTAIFENRDILTRAGQKMTDSPSGDFVKRKLLGALVHSPVKALNWAWRTGDLVFRIYDYKNELAKLQKAFPNRPVAELEREAALLVRDQRPNYSRLPKSVRALRNIPLVGTFTSWPSEIVRTSANTLARTIWELNHDGYRQIGAARLLGMIAGGLIVTGIASISAQKWKVKKEKEKAIKRFVDPWAKDSDLLFLNVKDGQVTYADTSFADPYKVLKEPVMAYMRKGGDTKGLIEALKVAFKPYYSESILTSTVIDLHRNLKDDGKHVYNPQDSGWKIAWDMLKYFAAKAAAPGGAIAANRMYLAATGLADTSINPKGRLYDLKTELMAFAGLRARTLDIAQSVSFKGFEFKEAKKDVEHIFEDVLTRRGVVKPDVVRDKFQQMLHRRDEIYKEFSEDVKAARLLGVSDNEIITRLRASGMAPVEIDAAVRGVTPPYRPDVGIMRSAEALEPARVEIVRELLRLQQESQRR